MLSSVAIMIGISDCYVCLCEYMYLSTIIMSEIETMKQPQSVIVVAIIVLAIHDTQVMNDSCTLRV